MLKNKTALHIAAVCLCSISLASSGQAGYRHSHRQEVKAFNPKRTFQLKDLPATKLKVGKAEMRIWIMDNDPKREEGMMFLNDREVSMNEGMLFVFRTAEPLSFWMRNTLIPLDIAFLDQNRKILNTLAMAPLDESPEPSKGPAMYALEMKQGAFKKYGIKAGMHLDIDPKIKAKG